MKKTLFCGLFCILSCSLIYSQNLEKLIKLSQLYLNQKQIVEFENTYPRLYEEFIKENEPSYKVAVKSLKEEDFESAIASINDVLEQDLLLDEIELDDNFSTLHNRSEWDSILTKISFKKNKYNEELRKELSSIQNRDQSIRILYQYVTDDSLKILVHDYMKVIDEESVVEVCNILDKYGWLGKEDIGGEANQTLFLVIQHIDDLVLQKKYLPVLKNAVDENRAEAWQYAFLTDRILMNQGKKQMYGTQKIIGKDPTKSFIVPLEQPEKVDELRKSVGLESLSEDLAEDGIVWSLANYLKDLPRIEKLYKEYQQKKLK